MFFLNFVHTVYDYGDKIVYTCFFENNEVILKKNKKKLLTTYFKKEKNNKTLYLNLVLLKYYKLK